MAMANVAVDLGVAIRAAATAVGDPTTDSAIALRVTAKRAAIAVATATPTKIARQIKTNRGKLARKTATAMRSMISTKPVLAMKAATCKRKSAGGVATRAAATVQAVAVAVIKAAAPATTARLPASIPRKHPLATSRKTASASKATAVVAVVALEAAVVAEAVVAAASAAVVVVAIPAAVAAVVVVGEVVVEVVAEADVGVDFLNERPQYKHRKRCCLLLIK